MERWRRQWRERGDAEGLSKGSPGRPRLSDAQITRLERELERGLLVHGWSDQRWTLARVKTAANLDQLPRAVKRKLEQIQYRPHLIDGCLTGTDLVMDS
ncbi:hypothetical protein GCM10009664_27270 [Kitasatospora gansuensis]